MDLALTYRCNNRCVHCYNEAARAKNELTIGEWKQVLDKSVGDRNPACGFYRRRTDPDPISAGTDRPCGKFGDDHRIEYQRAEIKRSDFVETLVNAGLDHVQITLESHDAKISMIASLWRKGAWQETTAGIRNALASPLYVMTNTTLLRSNSASLAETSIFWLNWGSHRGFERIDLFRPRRGSG